MVVQKHMWKTILSILPRVATPPLDLVRVNYYLYVRWVKKGLNIVDRNLENVPLRGRRMFVNQFGHQIFRIHKRANFALSQEFSHSLWSEETESGAVRPIVVLYADTSVLEIGKSQPPP